ncbi:TPA: restriction endonuclease subunit S, partial [Haemophilus influenzae]
MSKITVKEFSTNLDKFRVPLSSFEREKRKGLIPYYGAAKIIDYVDGFTHTGLSVLIAEDGSVETKNGYPVVQLANGEYWVNNHTHVLKSGDDIDTTYLYYALQTIKVAPFVTGAVQKKISQQALNSMEIPYFEDKTDRKRIVEILSSFDEKIQLNTQINQTLEQIAQALFKSWFVDFDPVRAKVQALSNGMSLEQVELAAMQAISGKTPEELTALSQTQPEHYAELAETAKAFPCEMVEIDGVEVPKGWEVKRIDEVIQKIPVGKKYSSKTAFSEGLVPILDQGRSGVIGYHNDKPGVKASIEDPIIVFANHTCYMRLISYDFSAIQNVFAFKGKECNLYWLYLATLGKQEFVEYKGHFPDFLIKEIIVPPEELTELFGKYIKENFSKIFINDRENSNLA